MRVLLLALSIVLPVCADTKGQEVIDRALKALGGQAFLSMQDRTEEGRAYSFYNERLTGLTRARISTRYLTRPEPPQAGFIGQRERQVLGKTDDYYNLFTEEDAWEVTYRGAKPFPRDLLQRWRDSLQHNVFYILRMRMGEPGLTFDYRGREVVDNQAVDVIEIVDSVPNMVTVYFSSATGLPVKQEWERRDPKTKLRNVEVSLFTKYRDVGGGVQWPFAIRRDRNGEKIFEMFTESVKINQGLTDQVFGLPGDVKVLDKKN